MNKLLLALFLTVPALSHGAGLDLNKSMGVVAHARHLSVKVIALKHYDVFIMTMNGIEQKQIYGYSMGTGYFIGKNTVLTEDHITNGAEKIMIQRGGSKEFEEVVMISSSPTKDLSIIRTLDSVNSEVIFSEDFFIGQKVIVVGNAGADDFEIAEARVAGVSILVMEDESLRTTIQLDSKGKIRPGFSGGAVFNMGGGVIGMVEATNGEGYGMAIQASEIVDFLAEQGQDAHRSIMKYSKEKK